MTRQMRADPIARSVALGVAGLGVVATIARLGQADALVAQAVLYLLITWTYLVAGLVLRERRPAHPIGPLLLTFGVAIGLFLAGDAFVRGAGPSREADIVAGLVNLVDGPMFALIAMLFLVFPTGQPPSPRWRVLILADLILAATVAVAAATRTGPIPYYPAIENPFGVAGFPGTEIWAPAYLLLVGSVGLGAFTLVGRWRRGDVVERAQLKWAALAATLIALTMGAYATLVGPGRFDDLADITTGLAFGFFPVAVGIAILRYRLFEIDRIISRTIAYVVVSAMLVASYAGVILLLQGPLGSMTGGETIPVAISTLVVAALFQPLRHRVQSVVDRRFDRARFDSERAAAAFAERLRAEVDIDAVTDDLRTTVERTLRPTHQTLWLRRAVA